MPLPSCDSTGLCGISRTFILLSPSSRQVAHVLLTRPPLGSFRRTPPARLACVRHAASVRPEPGSNSQIKILALELLKLRSLSTVQFSKAKLYMSLRTDVARLYYHVISIMSTSNFLFDASSSSLFILSWVLSRCQMVIFKLQCPQSGQLLYFIKPYILCQPPLTLYCCLITATFIYYHRKLYLLNLLFPMIIK